MSRLAIAVTVRGIRCRGYDGPVRPVRVHVEDSVANKDLPAGTEVFRLPRSWCRGGGTGRVWNEIAIGRPLVRLPARRPS